MPVPRNKAARGKAGKTRRAAVAAASAAAPSPPPSSENGGDGGTPSLAGGRRGKRPPASSAGTAAAGGSSAAAAAAAKRGRGADGRPPPPAAGTADAEDGLEYEDPYGDDFESGSSDGELSDGGGVGATEGGSGNASGAAAPAATLTRVFRPGVDELSEGETLVCDPSAYEVRVGLTLEWPALSFDLVSAGTGGGYPLDLTLVAGTQADSAGANALVAIRLSAVHRNRRARPGRLRNGDGEGDGEEGDTDSGSDDSDSGADDDDAGGGRARGPVLASQRVPFEGTVNRVRVCPHASGIVAAWSDTGRVAIHDLSTPLAKLTASAAGARAALTATAKGVRGGQREPAVPVADYGGHGVEGYALAWSPLIAGRLASGDVNGCIRLWEAASADGGGGGNKGGGAGATARLDSFAVTSGGAYRGHAQNSVEDIVWSPVEASVFASASTDGSVRVWDVRSPGRVPAVGIERAHDTDVNVLGWNSVDTHLLVSGGDEGALRVWDLRALVPGGAGGGAGGPGGASPAAAADFAVHRKPITAVEWHPTDSSVLAAASEDGTSSVWDLAVERDAEEELRDGTVLPGSDEYPPQLLFMHAGQKNVKELHWGGGGGGGAGSSLGGVGGVILTSAEDGLNVWKAADIS